jgi:hypothetical protein
MFVVRTNQRELMEIIKKDDKELSSKSILKIFEYILKIGVPASTIIGFLCYFLYYSCFNIYIHNYIEPSEIVNIFLPYFIFFSLYELFGESLRYYQKITGRLTTLAVDPRRSSKSFFYLWLRDSMPVNIICCILMIIYIFFIFNYYLPYSVRFLFSGIAVLFVLANLHVLTFIDLNRRAPSYRKFVGNISGILTTFSLVIVLTLFYAFCIKDKIFHNKTSIELKNNSVIQCNDTLLYVGNVRNYFFLYDLSKAEPIIYKMDEVKFIHLRNERPWVNEKKIKITPEVKIKLW